MIEGPWFVSQVVCLSCGHRWVAVYEATPDFFECSKCGEMEGARDD